MKNMNNEPMKLLKPGTETEAGIAGQRRVGTWVNLGKGGREVGKRTGPAHLAPGSTRLGPDNSMQVVDFPHLAHASLFWGRPEMVLATDETRIKHGCRNDVEQEGTEPSGAWNQYGEARGRTVQLSARKCG